MLNIKVVILPNIFYLEVYFKDVSGVNIVIYYLFLLITGDENGVYKYYKFIISKFIGCGYMG